jgi:hypothetical protein
MPEDHDASSSTEAGAWKLALGSCGTFSVVMFAMVGVWARQSRSEFLGLPTDGVTEDFGTVVKQCAAEGLDVVISTVFIAFQYATENVWAVLAVLIITALVLFLSIWPLRKSLQRPWIAAAAVALLVTGTAGKLLFYDAPTLYLRDVLISYPLDSTYFEAPPFFARRVDTIWRDMVCARMTGSNTPFAVQTCTAGDGALYNRHVAGRYLLDVAYTTIISVIAVLLGCGVLLHWRRSGSLPLTAKILTVTASAVSVLIAISGLALAYSRTARSTQFLYDNERRAFVMCTSATRCFDYSTADGFHASAPTTGNDMRDALGAYLDDVANRPDVSPPPVINIRR